MNCANWEERIALYAGGELAAAKAAEVERHLAECAGCQVFASGLKGSMSLVREAHQDAIDAAHFAAVRSRVLAQLEHERRPVWRRAWVYGIVAVAAALVVAFAVRPSRRVVPRPPEAAMVRPPAPAVARTALPPRPVRVRRKPRPKAAPAEQVLVRLVTDNPDVVIYWISETRGE